MVANCLTYLFPGAKALKLIRHTANITNSTSPLQITKNITLTVIDCCAPTPLRLTAHCLAAGSVILASLINPNPVTIGSAIHLVSEIYDDC
jgi:hypothetical protein